MLPIQEDETGLVIWALWQHYRIHGNLDFAMGLYTTLVVPTATWMAGYVDGRNGLVKPSWDLWEERWGVHAFTIGAVWAGLRAAADFAELYGDAASEAKFREAAERLRGATDTHLYRPDLGRFVRRLTIDPDGTPRPDGVLDSAIYGLWRFGMYDASDPRVLQTMSAIRDQLANRASCGGQARRERLLLSGRPRPRACPRQPLVHLHSLARPVVHRDRADARRAGTCPPDHRLGGGAPDRSGDAV